MSHTIFHISDLHFGPPYDPERGRLILEEARRLRPALTVVSGDLVQRADQREQWLQARAFLEQLPEPRLIVPGNHDIPAYNPFARFLWPLRRYKKYISRSLLPVFESEDIVVVGVDTTRPLGIDGGKLSNKQLAKLEDILSRYPEHFCKIVVTHHHIAPPPGESRKVMPNAHHIRRVLDRMGVELVLCGHTHASYIGNTLEFDPLLESGTVIVQAGTATSRRGRRWYRGKNAYFTVEVGPAQLVVTENLYMSRAQSFVPVSRHIFPRRSAGVYTLQPIDRASTASPNGQVSERQSKETSEAAGPQMP